ncbi:MAG TPA: alginate lyase family protein [Actinomycetota bacterium]|nr:alginate lyase family protein [Actinomycetota bacterium]
MLRPEEGGRVASDAAARTFEFIGVRRDRVRGQGWTDPSTPRLWRFHLNGFRWAWAMAADAGGWGPALAALVEEWRIANPPRRGDPWHPVVTAERLLSLLGTRALWLPHVRDPEVMSRWLWRHVHFVRTALERDVGGNHLIREAASLVAAGVAFRSSRLEARAIRLLTRAIGHQVLPDGGHEERSPSYHLEVLMDLAEVRSLLPSHHPFQRSLRPVLDRMADFGASLCHPDGNVAMFNDCTPWPVPAIEFLQTLGLDPHLGRWFPESGYYVLGDGEDLLFFDAGPPSPPDLPPHAHCDLLAIEVSVGGRRILVNSGTGDYARGDWRDYWRSTRAHNTVEVDRTEQSEVWHSFRMARRASPLDVDVLDRPDGVVVTAAHDGYRRLRPAVTHRRLVARLDRGWVVVDTLEGAGRHSLRSFLHLQPEVNPAEVEGAFILERGGSRLAVCPLGGLHVALRGARTEPVENWVAETLGRREPGLALVMEATVALPALFGWVLLPGAGTLQARIEGTPPWFRVIVQDEHGERVVDPGLLAGAGSGA